MQERKEEGGNRREKAPLCMWRRDRLRGKGGRDEDIVSKKEGERADIN